MTTLHDELGAWLPQARAVLEAVTLAPHTAEFGRIESVGDGIARISGLPGVGLSELLRFENGDVGFVLGLDAASVHCVLLDASDRLSAGMRAYGTGQVVTVPVGEALPGRVLDPLGRPLDGHPPPTPDGHQPIERAAPAIIERDLVVDPVQTGLLVIDALFALGRGQRELIIGDHTTGKTAIATDTLINQRDSDLICVYVAVGQKSSAVERVIDAVRSHGAPERTVFVVAPASAPPGLQWIAPFAGVTIAEYFRDRGRHALVVIDDLTKHAATHRELALLTHQPPGREAYPGDVFHLHARLLERAARLSPERGGGSLTALPIAETESGNLSAYIPTNLISITDGQIVLNTPLFHAGYMPAVDTGLSVSRVGGKTQAPLLRKVVQTLRLDYAQFLELEMFTRFGAVLEPRVQAKIARGERMRAVLAQPQFAPLPLAVQVALLLALQRGAMDRLEIARIDAFKAALPAWLAGDGKPLADAAANGSVPDQTELDAWATSLGDLAARFADAPAAPAP